MTNGTRMINGLEFTLAGLETKEGAQIVAKKYRAMGHKVRIIRKDILNYQIWKSAS